MEPLNKYFIYRPLAHRETTEKFIEHEQKEIRYWYRQNRLDLDRIQNDIDYVYRGRFVQSEPRGLVKDLKLQQKSRKTKKNKDKNERKRKKGKKGLTLQELRQKNDRKLVEEEDNHDTPENENNDQNSQDENELLRVLPLLFCGLHSRNLYTVTGRLEQTSSSNTAPENDRSDSEEGSLEVISDSESEDDEFSELTHQQQIYSKISKKIRREIANDSQKFIGRALINSAPERNFRVELNGIENFPLPLQVANVRRESPRIQLLMSSLSPSTQNFLARNKSAPLHTPENPKAREATPDIIELPLKRDGNLLKNVRFDEHDVTVNFYDYDKYFDNFPIHQNSTLTARRMVSNILYRAFIEKKYELARRAMGVYVREIDSDIRFVYSIALKILERRQSEREQSMNRDNIIGTNSYLSSSYNTGQNIAEDEEFIRWLIVGYPAISEKKTKWREFASNVEFNLTYVLKLLKKPSPHGYEEAIEYLNDLLMKAPYLDEPIFYILRAAANTQLAFDKENMTAIPTKSYQILKRRINAIDEVHKDLEKSIEIGGEGFYPKEIIDSQLESLDHLQTLLREGKDLGDSDSDSDSNDDSNGNSDSESDSDSNSNSDSEKEDKSDGSER